MSLLDLLREAAERPNAPVTLTPRYGDQVKVGLGYGYHDEILEPDLRPGKSTEAAICMVFLENMRDTYCAPKLVGAMDVRGRIPWACELGGDLPFDVEENDDSPAVAVVLAWLQANPKEEATNAG